MREFVLSVRALCKSYQMLNHSVQALKQVSFDVQKGEMLAIMGTSGSGKSTLLNILGAMDTPDSGNIILNGQEVTELLDEPKATQYRSENVGFIFQSYHLLKDLSVEDNIALPLVLKNMDETIIKKEVNGMIDALGLIEWRKHRPVELSGGQQQRVAIGRALISSPPLLLADEPTGNLDYNTSTDILVIIKNMKQSKGQSMIVVTHDAYVASQADRVLFFHDGQAVDEYVCTQDGRDLDRILAKTKAMLEEAGV
ncbi:ABC transporter ATP-binding protein [Paenibacillus montaniterrae]|uniref:ABC transporter ATP-binding protein n=1 Tax=Paenibacillus montaniterrae TaxID=429341 RepID=A0A920CXP5_9BACL|nr:ABC transporter ATP-binding protein [Paenibacillus montaniterrae]GIP17121.1 ABC transporter ATP-binding protein [Paenibacillus montaniterrae]